jgi:hypothetical protein
MPIASADECRKARNELPKRYHPDNGIEPNPEMMAKVNQTCTEAIAWDKDTPEAFSEP